VGQNKRGGGVRVYRADTVIIGAGFAGLSTAYHLSKRGRKSVLVIEQDKKLGGHSSGRNAGMIRQAVEDPVLARLAIDGRKRLSREAGRWKGVSFRSNGSLLLAKKNGLGELKKTAATLGKMGLGYRWLSRERSASLVPILKRADFETALFCPTDAFVEIRALLHGFLGALKKRGVPVIRGCRLSSIQKHRGGFLIKAGNKNIFAKQVVNAAGAWAGLVGKIAGAVPVPLVAYRRHLYETKAFGKSAGRWPFVWDVSRHFYFRPIRRGLLLSPCDKQPFKLRFGKRPGVAESVDPRMKQNLMRKLKGFSKNLSQIKIGHGKAGLRTMAPDGRFVIGEDPKLKGFFWVAGLGGHGVTTSFSVGNLVADLIFGRKREKFLVEALSPKRFFKR